MCVLEGQKWGGIVAGAAGDSILFPTKNEFFWKRPLSVCEVWTVAVGPKGSSKDFCSCPSSSLPFLFCKEQPTHSCSVCVWRCR